MGKETFAEYAKTNRPNSSKLAMKNVIFIICLFFIACYNGQVMKKEACINFVKHEELGKYPFEKSIKYTLQIDNQNVPVYCYAHVFKGNIVSLELKQNSRKNKKYVLRHHAVVFSQGTR